MSSYTQVENLKFTMVSEIGIIPQLQYKEEKGIAVMLILVVSSGVILIKYKNSVIDNHSQKIKLNLRTVG